MRHWTVGSVLVLVHGSAQLPGHLHVVDEDEVDDPQGSYFTRSEMEHLGERGTCTELLRYHMVLGMACFLPTFLLPSFMKDFFSTLTTLTKFDYFDHKYNILCRLRNKMLFMYKCPS
jgi:hypothetical protein